MVSKMLDVRILDFFLKAALPNLLVTAASVSGAWALLQTGFLEGWFKVIGGAALTTILHGILTWSFVLDGGMRTRMSAMVLSRLGKSQ
jgi:hypothetical protein